MNTVRIAILNATFRRATSLERALRSVAAQRVEPHVRLRAIVANNDPDDPLPAEIVARGALVPAVDFECPLLSLPLAFKTDLDSVPAPLG